MEYYEQPIERNARIYAETAAHIYYLTIDSILNKQTDDQILEEIKEPEDEIITIQDNELWNIHLQEEMDI